MMRMAIRIPLFIIPLLAFSAFISGDNPFPKDEALVKAIIQDLGDNHYQPVPIDDDFSRKAYQLYIKRLDYNKRFLIQEDIAKLKKFETKIDDEITKGKFDFFDLSIQTLDQRISDVESFYAQILEAPFDFTLDESYQADSDKKDFAADKKALRDDWRKMLKYEVLTRIDEQLTSQEKQDSVVEKKSLETIEKESREKVLKRYQDWFRRIHQEDRDDRLAFYINCLVNVYDPHSGYFPPKDKENFDIQMSGQLEGIGAQLQEKDGYIKVANIVPGSPSWKQGQLKEGDLILKVGQGSQEPVDVVDMRLDDAVKLIRGKKGTEVRLSVKKPDGSLVNISIIRDVVILEETFAKSVVLTLPGSDARIGYVYLPSFYADFNGNNGRRASVDVKKEIEKLKAENIDGLIFDLRNDGGGSLLDAVDIAGLFIDKGPIVQVKGRWGLPYVYDDRDPSVFYKDPLLVMVNTYSASASEIFSAAIQDYGRGIIVGSPYTFGKGTVQRFVELDNNVMDNEKNTAALGSLKVTIQKFYRINGGSTQLKGVIPDIIFPDPYGELDRGEKEMDYPMEWSSINPVPFNKWPGSLPIEQLKSMARDRTQSSTDFSLVEENAKRMNKLREETLVSLKLDTYRKKQEANKAESKKFEKMGKEPTNLGISALKTDLQKILADSAAQARSDAWHKNLKKDIFLLEAAHIMKDMQARAK